MALSNRVSYEMDLRGPRYAKLIHFPHVRQLIVQLDYPDRLLSITRLSE